MCSAPRPQRVNKIWSPWHLVWLFFPFSYHLLEKLFYVAGVEGCSAEPFAIPEGFVFIILAAAFRDHEFIAFAIFISPFLLAFVQLVRARNWKASAVWVFIPAFTIVSLYYFPWDFFRFTFHWLHYESALQAKQNQSKEGALQFVHFYEVEPCMYLGGAGFDPYEKILLKRPAGVTERVEDRLPARCSKESARQLGWTDYFVTECTGG